MCGRYTLKTKRETIAEAFDLSDVPWVSAPLQHRPDSSRARRLAQPKERTACPCAASLGPCPVVGR